METTCCATICSSCTICSKGMSSLIISPYSITDNASLDARKERIVELYFARKSDALYPLIVIFNESVLNISQVTSSHARLAANATLSLELVVIVATQVSLFFVTTLFSLRRLSALEFDGLL